ncbi:MULTISPECIES: hypothetical protein [unclassified Coleofasciculus]|nr:MULTISPECIES: hypothetical protein [unclassified Coleofasciculus]
MRLSDYISIDFRGSDRILQIKSDRTLYYQVRSQTLFLTPIG